MTSVLSSWLLTEFVAGEAEHPAPASLARPVSRRTWVCRAYRGLRQSRDVTPDDVVVVVDLTGSSALATQLQPAPVTAHFPRYYRWIASVTAGRPGRCRGDPTDFAIVVRRTQPKYVATQLVCFLAVDAIRSNLVQRIERQRLRLNGR